MSKEDQDKLTQQGKDVPLLESEDDLGIDSDVDGDADGHADDGHAKGDESGEDKGRPSDQDDPDGLGEDGRAEGDNPAGKKTEAVPYVRFKEVIDQKKAALEARETAEREVAELRAKNEALERQAAIAAAKPADEEALRQAIRDAKKRARDAELDDDNDALQKAHDDEEEARQRLVEARINAKREVEQRLAAEDAQRRTAQTEQEKLNVAAAELIEQYPALQHDEQATRYILADRDALILKGKSWGDALREATHAAAKRLGLTPAKPGVKSLREQDSIRKHAEAAARLPSRDGPAGEGMRSRTTSRDMSEREWDALPEDEKEDILGISRS